ncbi:phosphohydrolase [Virgibacillus indicus]|uniref:bis(5'-nucleosyl)-tetraphosphatase (symmetrical) n=1 Tax=Virgibacillus indicus TaxID=2024554 RepID=A0A265NDL6_9BACI|nr:bis(5'-nucleosyl)-tetraphosphatase (symmetrical) YqeK [Virgibacillus indicus]OZU89907.1 phosphohydrolase [Virgibacillus indicus]
MEIKEAIEHVRPHLTQKRFDHTLRVAETAVSLADQYKVSKEKTELAAIFHDYAKYRPLDEMKRWIISSRLPKDLLLYHHELWHGPVGAILIEREFGIKDPDIQLPIQYHTTGRAHMSEIEKVIFLADYIEPGRSFPGIEEVRNMARKDLTHACLLASRNTIQFLMNKKATIYPETFHAYNDLIKQYGGN